MPDIETRWHKALRKIEQAEQRADRPKGLVKLVLVCKSFNKNSIDPLVQAGQRIFAENRIEEAHEKWQAYRSELKNLELHFIGKIQSRKVKEVVEFFDVIETLDREKIAAKIAQEITQQGKSPELYVQVNIGCESQKSGVLPQETHDLIKCCRNKYHLKIKGLMCIPPINEAPEKSFRLLGQLAKESGVDHLSMGMSDDYEQAIASGSTSVRIGRAILGQR